MNLFLVLIICIFIYFIIKYFMKNDFTEKELKILFFLIISSLVGLAVTMYPKYTGDFSVKTFDLYRYYFQMDDLRNGSFEFAISFIFEKMWFGFRFVEYIVAMISKYNTSIFIVTIPITVGIYAYILYNSNKEGKLSKKQIVISMLVFFSIINPIHMLSGIRNGLAVSIHALGQYLVKIKNKKYGYIFYFLAVFFHPMIVIFIIIDGLVPLLKKYKYSSVFLLGIVLIYPLIAYGVNFLDKIMYLPTVFIEKINSYLFEANYYNKKMLVCECVQVIALFMILYRIKKNNKDNKIDYFYYVSLLIIGFIPYATFFMRIRFIISYFVPVIFVEKNKLQVQEDKYDKFIEDILFITSIVQIIYYSVYMYNALI